MIDAPHEPPRGGGALETVASNTGRKPASKLPGLRTLPEADVRVVSTDGTPLRGTRSDADGGLSETTLVDVPQGTKVIVTAFDGDKSQSQVVTTI